MADSQRKTANLWDENMSDISSSMTYKPLYVGNNAVTMSSNIPQASQGYANLFLKRGQSDSGATTGDNGVWNGNPRTFEPIGGYVTVAYRNANGVNPQDYNIMLNEGQTALPYEPKGWGHSLRKLTTATEAVENPLYSDGTAITAYTIKGNTVQDGTSTPSNPVDVNGVGELDSGQYKIPISSGGVTTNIYLGRTQTVRRIKKIIFDGTEDNWRITGTGRMGIPLSDLPQRLTTPYCTHFIGTTVESYGNMGDGECSISVVNGSVREFGCYVSTITTLADFKTWLSQQYANGTPVIVWYVLATPTTGIVNEPLMKIGNYADTLSNAAQIPTTEGANSITVDTTVQPSEFTATWTGWHDAEVKEYMDGEHNLFDDTNVITIAGLGNRYGVILPNGTYSIYNGTDNTVYDGVDNFQYRHVACEPHSTATVTLNTREGTNCGFLMALESASQGGVTIVTGNIPPDHYTPYYEWL